MILKFENKIIFEIDSPIEIDFIIKIEIEISVDFGAVLKLKLILNRMRAV